MKTLTLLQPWASLVAIGAKRIGDALLEGRRSGRIGQEIAIHASARRLPGVADSEPFRTVLEAAGYHTEAAYDLPLGAVVAVARLRNCLSTPPADVLWREHYGGVRLPPEDPNEAAFGDYSPGRFAWLLEDVRRIEPIPAKGMLGLWEWAAPEGLTR